MKYHAVALVLLLAAVAYCSVSEDVQTLSPDLPSEEPAELTCVDCELSMSWAGGVTLPGPASDVAIAGTYAYVAAEESGLQTVDISTSESFPIVGSVDTPGCAWGVAVAGPFAYVADASGALHVIDISSPGFPSDVRGCVSKGEPRSCGGV